MTIDEARAQLKAAGLIVHRYDDDDELSGGDTAGVVDVEGVPILQTKFRIVRRDNRWRVGVLDALAVRVDTFDTLDQAVASVIASFANCAPPR